MSVFIGKVKLEERKTPSEDKLYGVIWNEIAEPLKNQHGSDRASAAEEATSRALLAQALERSRKLLPKTKRYRLHENFFDVCYFGILLKLQSALRSEKWGDACYQVQKMIRYYRGNDVRILYTIIGILEEFL